MAKEKDDDKTPDGAPLGASTKAARRVEVICEGFLGTQLLKNGDVTSDPEYVALVGDPRNLVREI